MPETSIETSIETHGPGKLKSLSYFSKLKKVGLLNLLLELHKDYGDWVKLGSPAGDKVYFVNNPEDILFILQTQSQKFIKGKSLELFKLLVGKGLPVVDGETWRQQRRVLQPTFHRQTLENYGPLMFETTVDHVEKLLKMPGPVDLNSFIARLTHDLVAKSLLGADINDSLKDLHASWSEALNFIVDRSYQIIRLPLSMPTPKNLRFRRAMKTVNECVDRIIHLRISEKGSVVRDDLLSRLLKSRDGGGEGALDDRELRDQILAFLFAGHDTTANNIAWTLFLIHKDPVVEERVRKELREVFGSREVLNLDGLDQLEYLRKVTFESLRLFPPAAMFVREALEDVNINGRAISKGSIIVIAPYVFHRSSEIWPQPEKFDPERFVEPLKRQGVPKFLAFGYGARSCIGEQFAIMESRIVISALMKRVKFNLSNPESVKPHFHGTLSPKGLKVTVTPTSQY